MGDAVAIGDLASITSCESWSWEGGEGVKSGVCWKERKRKVERGGGGEERRKRKEEGGKEGGREYQMTSTSSI